jgi:hypothetical protein
MYFTRILDTQRYTPLLPPPPPKHFLTIIQVGGLPLAELNHLELQFLLLNDFRLSVPVEELEAYGTMLVEFYAREVIAQRQGAMPADMAYPEDTDTDMTAPTSP